MSMINCPVCRRLHVVNNYDSDYVCDNSVSKRKKMQNVESTSILTDNNWNLDEWNTKKDEYRDVYLDNLKKITSDKNKYAGGTESHNY